MVRVRWVVEDADRPGGVESVVRSLDRGLRERSLDSTVMSWHAGAGGSPSSSGPVGWLRSKISAAHRRKAAAEEAGRRLREELARDGDLVVVLDPGSLSVARHLAGSPRWGVHLHWSPDLVLAPWRHLAGERVPAVLVAVVSARMRVVGRRNRRLLAAAPFMVTLTASHTRALRDIQQHIHEIGNPVECGPVVRRVPPPVGATVTIGFVGRLAHEKGPDLLVEALARLGAQGGPLRTLVAGSGPLEEAVRRRSDELGLTDVEFLGWVEDPRSVLERVDVLVLPSRSEAVPLVLAEALAAGCRVVAADAGGGVRDVLKDGVLGRVVPRDDPGALAEAVEAAVRDVREGRYPDPGLVRELVREHSSDVVFPSWLRLLDELVSAPLNR